MGSGKHKPSTGEASSMDQATHNKIVSFIWGIADDVLRDLFKRGKYPDVILPMCVVKAVGNRRSLAEWTGKRFGIIPDTAYRWQDECSTPLHRIDKGRSRRRRCMTG